MVEIFTLSRISIALVIMCYAAVSDFRTRRVNNNVWIILGILAMAILAVELLDNEGYNATHFLIFVSIGILFFDVFWDREPVLGDGVNAIPVLFYLVALLSVLVLVYIEGFTRNVVQLLTIPGMILVAELFYYTGLLHGGADAKALMALAIMFPVYPDFAGLPLIGYPDNGVITDNLQIIFPFAFLLLMNAAIIQVVTVPLALFFKNLVKRDFGFPEMFLGYRLDIYQVRKRFVWPMEVVRDEEVVLIIFPKRGGDIKKELVALRDHGIQEIWVTPKIPFIIPMLAGMVFSILIGNLMVLMF